MLFLPSPLKRILETLLGSAKSKKGITSASHAGARKAQLSNFELHIICQSCKVVGQILVNVSVIKAAANKLKEIIWPYQECADNCVEGVVKHMIETVDINKSSSSERNLNLLACRKTQFIQGMIDL